MALPKSKDSSEPTTKPEIKTEEKQPSQSSKPHPQPSEPTQEQKTSCASPNCNKPVSTLKCPLCIKLNIGDSYFCTQECFKKNWKEHSKIHKRAKQLQILQNGIKTFKIPQFNYTGKLRPSYVTPMRTVSDKILKPDYWKNGTPLSEKRQNQSRPKEIPIYSNKDVEGIRYACKLGREVLDIATALIKPGITTEEIDIAVHEACLERECYPSPLNYRRFPKSCCTSINEVICHGIPDGRKLEDGDIINIDITVYKNGYHGDLNETFLVGNVEPKYMQLVKTTHDALMESIKFIKPNVMCRKFGEVIDKHVSKFGYSVTRTYCGHGIGKLFHCNPNIPHYKKNKAVGKLKPNMVFTIEPMINYGTWKDVTWSFDNWTSVTQDGKRSAQFEHTMVVTENGYEILTARTENSRKFWWEDKTEEYIKDIEMKALKAREIERKLKESKKDKKKDKKNKKGGGNKKKGRGKKSRR